MIRYKTETFTPAPAPPPVPTRTITLELPADKASALALAIDHKFVWSSYDNDGLNEPGFLEAELSVLYSALNGDTTPFVPDGAEVEQID